MKIYIASSWRNKHGVQLLTSRLRERGHEVISWIENCDKEGADGFQFEDWVNTEEADRCFSFDVEGAVHCDLFVYYGPAGKDACAELGVAYKSGCKIIGLHAKGEDLGLMRKMVEWYDDVNSLFIAIDVFSRELIQQEK